MDEEQACEVLERLNDAFDGKPVAIPTTKEINDAVDTLNPIVGTASGGVSANDQGVKEVNADTARELNRLADLAKQIRRAKEEAAEIAGALSDKISSKIPAAKKKM